MIDETKPDTLLTPKEAAEALRVSELTLQQWRYQHPGRLRYIRVGKSVRYRVRDLNAFLHANERMDTTDAPQSFAVGMGSGKVGAA